MLAKSVPRGRVGRLLTFFSFTPFCGVGCGFLSSENGWSFVRIEFDPPFELAMPEPILSPILFNSPHSGRIYPTSFLAVSRLGPLALRRSEDAFVDELFAPVVGLGMPLLKAHFPRAFVDVNREPYELDPEMFDGDLPKTANTSSLRVAGGLGTIPRIVAEAAEIYEGPLPVAEAAKRIEALYRPYHQKISKTLHRLQSRFGMSLLIDCHSMPSKVRGQKSPRADFVLGDRFGTSCAPHFTSAAEKSLRAMGYSVARNRPYAGGHITQSYGRPASGTHTLQIEINRSLYLNEKTIAPSDRFEKLRRNLTVFAADMRRSMPCGQAGAQEAAE